MTLQTYKNGGFMNTKASDLLSSEALEQFEMSGAETVNLIKTGQKVKVKNEFVMLFVENFQRLVPLLTKNELCVMLSILKFMNYQNVFSLTQKAISKDTGIPQANVSRAMKGLRERKILAENELGVGYINPYVFSKGHILEVKKNLGQLSLVFTDKSLESTEIQKPF